MQKHIINRYAACIFLVYSFIGLQSVFAAPDDEIRVGMSAPLKGPLQKLGMSMHTGIMAYFSKVNDNGGIQGRKIRLISLDDGYEPVKAAENMYRLIDEEQVLAILGNVGTPTATVTVPIIKQKKILFFGALSGAELLRQTTEENFIYNYRASYADEAATMVDCLIKVGVKPDEIAFFTQDDAYGDAGFYGAIDYLKQSGFTSIYSLTHGRYKRNTVNVEGAVATLLDAETRPRAVIMAGSYKPSAKYIKLVKQLFPEMLFLNLSFVGGEPLRDELGNDTKNVIITQVVPHYTSNLPITHEYLSDMRVYQNTNTLDFISFEGYIVAKIFVEAIREIKGEFNRDNILEAIRNINDLDIGIGMEINFSPDRVQAIDTVWPTMISNGEIVEIDWSKVKKIIQ